MLQYSSFEPFERKSHMGKNRDSIMVNWCAEETKLTVLVSESEKSVSNLQEIQHSKGNTYSFSLGPAPLLSVLPNIYRSL